MAEVKNVYNVKLSVNRIKASFRFNPILLGDIDAGSMEFFEKYNKSTSCPIQMSLIKELSKQENELRTLLDMYTVKGIGEELRGQRLMLAPTYEYYRATYFETIREEYISCGDEIVKNYENHVKRYMQDAKKLLMNWENPKEKKLRLKQLEKSIPPKESLGEFNMTLSAVPVDMNRNKACLLSFDVEILRLFRDMANSIMAKLEKKDSKLYSNNEEISSLANKIFLIDAINRKEYVQLLSKFDVLLLCVDKVAQKKCLSGILELINNISKKLEITYFM